MKLWHYKLIPFLPNSQLVAQWRELNSIFKKQDKHILINYVYEYSKTELFIYSTIVEHEMIKRKINFKYSENYKNYFNDLENKGMVRRIAGTILIFKYHHTNRYLLQCFYNLQEKYDRGQKDFTKEQYEKLEKFVREVK